MTASDETLLKFPCTFSLKVFGLANELFETTVMAIIRKHVEDLRENALRSKFSKDAKYLSLTIIIEAQSKAQLDAIYQELTASDVVLMAL